MRERTALILLAATLLFICPAIINCQRPDWIVPLITAWNQRDLIANKFYCGLGGGSTPDQILTCFDNDLNSVISQLENFLINIDLTRGSYSYRASNLAFTFSLDSGKGIAESNFGLSSLNQKYTQTLGSLLTHFSTYLDQSQPSGGYVLPLTAACSGLPAVPEVTVKEVCPTINECAQSPYSSSENACTQDNKCDVNTALPLMVGVLFYRISFAFVDKFCTSSIELDTKMAQTLQDLKKEIQLMKAYIMLRNPKPFDSYYREGISNAIYSDIRSAMNFISDNELTFAMAPLLCQEIGADVCGTADAVEEYLMLKGLQNKRRVSNRGNTRNLRLFRDIDHQQFISFMQETVNKLHILASIDSLDENLMAQTAGMTSYFRGIASYDQRIAEADVTFIKDKLEEFDTKYNTLTEEMRTKMGDIVGRTIDATLAQLAEQVAGLAAIVAENGNPLKALFSGVGLKDMLDQAATIAATVADKVRIHAIFNALTELGRDTETLGNNLQTNGENISAMKSLVDKIKKNQADQIQNDVNEFVKQYSDYTPQVDRSDLERNIQTWAVFQQATCEVLHNPESVSGGAISAVASGKLLCEKLEALIAELGALRENIFDFQFDLIDSLAKVVKGNLATKTAENIGSGEVDTLRADKLFTAFLMAQNRIQQHAWVFCDKIMYKNNGIPKQICSQIDELFDSNSLASIVSYRETVHYTDLPRTVYIPSQPQFTGDTGFISIPTLVEKRQVSFRLPRQIRWLRRNNWVDSANQGQALYIKKFHLFLPNKDYTVDAERVEKTYSLTVKVNPGSFVSTSSEVYYQLPEAHSTFNTEYKEGYTPSSCSHEIDNPYSLCDNLPKVCFASDRDSSRSEENLMPTVFSSFTVTLNGISSGGNSFDWPDPKAVTPIRFVAKVTFAKPSAPSQGDDKKTKAAISNDGGQNGICCQGNRYRKKWNNNTCLRCPEDTQSVMGSYYCEIVE